ncbi:outer membrane protein [Loktanella sp. Alg231-35]|uniref:outer membrane protein n=1 Tax=Loktanella sp. Alg231-35 TaxID=1922220 RepID=UPI000D552F3D|nr:hypothetical protein [Loktanella sp. Alg231-35]
MKTLIAALFAAALGTTTHAQEVYVGGGLDYLFPHSGDAQSVASLIAGFGIETGGMGLGAEIDAGSRIAGDNDYDTLRVRILASYDWNNYTFRAGGGVTEYYFDDDTAGGYNAGFGAERALTPNVAVRGELIRDFMDNTFTAAVTTTRVAVLYSF